MAFRKIDLQLIDTDVANIEDPLLVFNYGITGNNAYDVGTIYARGSYDNVGLIWDESADQFAIIVTSEDGSTTGDVSISSYANLRANTITANLTGDVTGDVTGNLTGDVTGDVTGDLTGNVTGNADSATTLTGLTSTITELNYSDGVTSNIQTQLDGKLSTSGGTISSNLTISGNLTVSGTTTTVNSTVVDIADPIITLGSSASDDNKDRGIAFKWNIGGNTKVGFFGFDDTDSKFTFITDGAVTNEVSSGTLGTIKVGGIDMSGDLDMNSNDILNVDMLRINQAGTGLRMTNVGAFDNDGSDNFRIFATNDLQLKANGDSGGGLSIDVTNNDVTIDNDLRVNAGQFYYGGTAVTATAAELNYVDGVTSAIQTQLNSKQASLTRNENSSPYIVTGTDATNNTGSTLAISAATLGFDLSDAVSYNIFINRLHMRSSEVSVNTSNGTITISADILETSDEIDAVWIT